MHLSAIVSCRNREELIPEEQEVTEKIIDDFKANYEVLKNAAGETGLEELDKSIPLRIPYGGHVSATRDVRMRQVNLREHAAHAPARAVLDGVYRR